VAVEGIAVGQLAGVEVADMRLSSSRNGPEVTPELKQITDVTLAWVAARRRSSMEVARSRRL
jgi:hypothetical protein